MAFPEITFGTGMFQNGSTRFLVKEQPRTPKNEDIIEGFKNPNHAIEIFQKRIGRLRFAMKANLVFPVITLFVTAPNISQNFLNEQFGSPLNIVYLSLNAVSVLVTGVGTVARRKSLEFLNHKIERIREYEEEQERQSAKNRLFRFPEAIDLDGDKD